MSFLFGHHSNMLSCNTETSDHIFTFPRSARDHYLCLFTLQVNMLCVESSISPGEKAHFNFTCLAVAHAYLGSRRTFSSTPIAA